MKNISQYFGYDFTKRESRIASYDYIENFMADQHLDWSTPPNTAFIVNNFIQSISKFSDLEFAFLIVHSGYIPESYEADSSAETLYSKLIETVVLEWAKRIGFKNSKLPTQKASMEDVSLLDDRHVIVCDAKSFRLGRSQGAPNVKDVLKHADIEKWLSAYSEDKYKRLGGLVTFPSQHDWKQGSDYYQYTTDKSSPTLSLYYEHLAYILISGMTSKNLISLYESYAKIFPEKKGKKENNRAYYYSQLHKALFNDSQEGWPRFDITAQKVISEKVYHSAHRLDSELSSIRENIENKYRAEKDIEVLRTKAIQAEYEKATDDFHKQKDRIHRFRTVAKGYHED